MDFKFPDVGEGITEGKLVAWKVKVGDTIKTDQTVAEVETDKAVVEIPSPQNGTVQELRGKEGDTLNVGDVFMVINSGQESANQPTESAPEAPAVEEPKPVDDSPKEEVKEEPKEESNVEEVQVQKPEETVKVEEAKPEEPQTTEPSKAKPVESRPDYSSVTPTQNYHGEIKATPKVRHLAKEKGIDLSSIKGTGAHGQITEADLSVGTPSSAPAQTHELPKFEDHEEQPTTQSKPETKPTGYQHQFSVADSSHLDVMATELLHVRASPSVRRLARELGVDIHSIQPASAKGIVTDEDIRHAANEDTAKTSDSVINPEQDANAVEVVHAQQENKTEGPKVQATQSKTPTVEGKEQLSTIRKAIAKKMTQANAVPQVTHVEEVDMTEIFNLRQKEKEAFAKRGIKLTYLPFIIKAIVGALEEFPIFNATYNDDNTATMHKDIHMGVAVDTPHGLMVPVIQHADQKSIMHIAKEIVDLATRAKDKKLKVEELSGSTFSVTSVGSLGGVFFTPIINYPEVGILGIGKIRDAPVLVNNQIYAKKMMYVSLSFDHRIVDGADAARFTNKIKEYLEDPQALFMERI